MKIYHVSEEGEIEVFKPRPSPSSFPGLTDPVVFGISENLLHNYLVPRNCPRLGYYAGEKIIPEDKERYFSSGAEYIMALESDWMDALQRTTIYAYEFNSKGFSLIDACAGYYISKQEVKPLSIRKIDNCLKELLSKKNLELRFLPSLWELADQVVASSLNYSLIRMKYAQDRKIKEYFLGS